VPKLSICIPTYNFGSFIGETLDSIIPQLGSEIELVIYDSNSTDQTEEVVKQRLFQRPDLSIRYFKAEVKKGIDRDIVDLVAMARGQYVWLFSADDVMLPGSISLAMGEIASGEDIYLVEHIICDFHLNPLRPYPIFKDVRPGTTFDFIDNQQRQRYFSKAITSEAFFSFLSTPIFKKNIWDRVGQLDEAYYKTNWGIAARLLTSSKRGMRVKYLAKQMLLKRGDNDSFMQNGRVNRLAFAIEGFHYIGSSVFGGASLEAFNIRRVLRNEISLVIIMYTKLLAYRFPEKESLAHLSQIVKIHYGDKTFINSIYRLTYNLSPHWALELVYLLVRSVNKVLFRRS
jgi:abequosyltransferase